MSAFGLSPPPPPAPGAAPGAAPAMPGIGWDSSSSAAALTAVQHTSQPLQTTHNTPSHTPADTSRAGTATDHSDPSQKNKHSPKDLRLRGPTGNISSDASFSIVMDSPPSTSAKKMTPFSLQFPSVLAKELMVVLQANGSNYVLALLVSNSICTLILASWSASSNSLALQACTYHTCFTLLTVLVSLLNLWVDQQHPQCSQMFTFGYERFVVLGLFASTILAQLGALMVAKEAAERLVVAQPIINTGKLTAGAVVSLGCQLLVVVLSKGDSALGQVVGASSSSCLQEHVADLSRGLCALVPGLSRLLLPRMHPVVLIALAGSITLLLTQFLLDSYHWLSADTFCGLFLAAVTCGTMFPLSSCAGRILLQTTPSHLVGQLDKCLRETLTLDGVLEFRQEHFWTLSFGKLAGSLHVRVRRDADEQLVLSHVVDRLSGLVPILTVQVSKDEWSGAHQASPLPSIGDTSFLLSMAKGASLSPHSHNGMPPSGSPQRWNPFMGHPGIPEGAPTPGRGSGHNLLLSGTRTLNEERFAYQLR